jgi:hypothetical protein
MGGKGDDEFKGPRKNKEHQFRGVYRVIDTFNKNSYSYFSLHWGNLTCLHNSFLPGNYLWQSWTGARAENIK